MFVIIFRNLSSGQMELALPDDWGCWKTFSTSNQRKFINFSGHKNVKPLFLTIFSAFWFSCFANSLGDDFSRDTKMLMVRVSNIWSRLQALFWVCWNIILFALSKHPENLQQNGKYRSRVAKIVSKFQEYPLEICTCLVKPDLISPAGYATCLPIVDLTTSLLRFANY